MPADKGLPTTCTVLVCRRCRHVVRKEEVFVINANEKHETWRCPDCGGVCDAVELNANHGQRKRGRPRIVIYPVNQLSI